MEYSYKIQITYMYTKFKYKQIMIGLFYITATFSRRIFVGSVFLKQNTKRRKMLMLYHNNCN